MGLLQDLSDAINIQEQRQDADFKQLMQKPLHERVSKGYTMTNLSIGICFYDGIPNNFCEPLPEGYGYIAQVVVHCANNISKFREGSTVMLRNGRHRFRMEVEKDGVNDFILKSNDFEVKNNCIDYNYPKTDWEIDTVNLNITHRLLRDNRDFLNSWPEMLARMDDLLSGRLSNSYAPQRLRVEDNPSQNEAISKALGCSDFHLIQGPPGTGKTRTIAKIVSLLVQQGKKVFVTANTHTAINNCLNVIAREVRDASKVVKIGEKYQAEEILCDEFGKEFITRKTDLPYQEMAFKKNYYLGNPKFSQEGFVIGATPFALCYPGSKKLALWPFDYVIIDEAAQLSIPLALAAMDRGMRLVLVGDHKQLDPIVPTGTTNPLFACSVFKRLADLYPHNITLLDQSYRLNDNLIRIPNELFYGGRLKSARKVEQPYRNFRCSHEPRITSMEPNAVMAVTHEFDGLGRSVYEAKMAAGIVADLLSNGVPKTEIGVITPYRAQVREIKKQLVSQRIVDEEALESLCIDVVERVQGQEKDYIIFSLANDNPAEVEDRLEFFYSPNRLNVAITRAKVKCIVIANNKIFSSSRELLAKPGISRELRKGLETFLRFYDLSEKIEIGNKAVGTGSDDW